MNDQRTYNDMNDQKRRTLHVQGLAVWFLRGIVAIGMAGVCHAQEMESEIPRTGYGVLLGGGVIMPNADFRSFPGVPSCCPRYGDGSGQEFLAGVQLDLPLTEELRLLVRGMYVMGDVSLVRDENVVVSGNQNGVFQHRVDATLHDVALEPLLSYAVFPPLSVVGGVRASYALTRTFSQVEQIMAPLDGVFPNGSSTRNEVHDAAIPQAQKLGFAAVVGVRGQLPLNAKATLVLQPEVLYQLGLTNLVSATDWSNSSLRAGVTLAWMPHIPRIRYRTVSVEHIDTVSHDSYDVMSAAVVAGQPVRREDVTTENDTIVTTTVTVTRTDTLMIPKDYPANVQLALAGVQPDGSTQPYAQASVVVHEGQEQAPLLPYIFYPEGSGILPAKYTASPRDSSQGYTTTAEAYYDLLNVVGRRMQQFPEARIRISGYNSGEGMELGNVTLSESRATAIRNYLTTTWRIDPARIAIDRGDVPQLGGRVGTPNGNAENRRAELSSSDLRILAPIAMHPARPNGGVVVRASVVGSSTERIARWKLTGTMDGRVVDTDSGTGTVAGSMDRTLAVPSDKAGSVRYELLVQDAAQRPTTTSARIDVRPAAIPARTVEYPVILFGIGASDIGETQQQVLNTIRASMEAGDEVSVTGYADNVGAYKKNLALAQTRATNVAAMLGGGASITTTGIVMEEAQIGTDPERRGLSRMAKITIRKRGTK